MEPTMCHGCQKLLQKNSGINIFNDDSVIKSFDSDGCYDNKWCIKLLFGLELITGSKITKEDKFPDKLCEICFKNVERYINFRHQLLKSRDIFTSASHQSNSIVVDAKSIETTNAQLSNVSKSKDNTIKKSDNLPEVNSLNKTLSNDLINVDDNSNTSFDLSNCSHNVSEINNSTIPKFENNQENNNIYNSDDSIDDSVNANIEVTDIKQKDHDVEFEIDVCSGEDDDVLELDIEKAKNETVEIKSSSESDIDVCDYEPTGKKGRYNNFSSPVRF